MTSNTLDELLVLIEKELTSYNTTSSLPYNLISDFEGASSSRTNGQRFSVRIGAKRRRLRQPAEAETGANGESRGIRRRLRVKMIEWAFKGKQHH